MVRVLAVEDGSFRSNVFLRKKKGKAFLICVLVDNLKIRKVFLSYVTVDGLDATDRLMEIIRKLGKSFDVIMLASVTCAGFNLIDPVSVYRKFNIPVLIVNPKKPNNKAVEFALKKHFKDWKERLKIICRAGKPSPLKVEKGKTVYLYCFGLPFEEAETLVKKLIVFGSKPEPLRIADLIAHGLGFVTK